MQPHFCSPYRAVLASSLLAACGGTSTGGTTGGAAFDGVTGTAIDTFATATGRVSHPTPTTMWPTIAAVVQGTAKPTSYPGTLAADGTLRIPDVPMGAYTLVQTTAPPPVPAVGALGATDSSVEQQRTLELGSDYSCRSGLVAMTTGTKLVLNASLGEPWQAYTQDSMGNVTQPNDDLLQFFSSGADDSGSTIAGPSDPNQSSPPANGATMLAGWTLNASSYLYGSSAPGGQPHLVDGGGGDTLVIMHNVTSAITIANDPIMNDPWQTYTADATHEVFQPAAFTMTNGGTSTLTGSFVAVPQKTFSFSYEGSAFNALLADAPAANPDYASVYFSVYHEPGTPVPGVGADGTLLELYVGGTTVYADPTCNTATCDPMACASGCNPAFTMVLPGDYAHDFSYGDPFTTGQELASVSLSFSTNVTKLLSGPSQNESLTGYVSVSGPASSLAGTSIQPVVGLPRNVKVNGAAAPVDAVTKGVGTTPTITFDAPSKGTPTYYRVTVFNMDALKAADGTITNSQFLGSFVVTGTAVTIPAGMLVTGGHYYFQVRAAVDPNFDFAAPAHLTEAQTYAVTYTGLVMP